MFIILPFSLTLEVSQMGTKTRTEGLRRAQFGVFEADLEAEELRRSGVRVRIQSQPFKLLAVFLEHPGQVVSRETLQQELWGTDTTVDFDHGLGIAVNKLREALGDSADNPRFVETLAKRGYRFIAPITVLDPAPAESFPPPVTAVPKDTPGRVGWWLAGAFAAGCLALFLLLLLRPPLRKPYRIAQITFTGHVLANDLDVESFSSSASDGTRIYFSHVENGNPVLAVALPANGEISRFNLPSEIGQPLISSLSPDGSRLILRSHLRPEPEQPLWIVPTLGGDARRVPNVLAHDATWMPDGNRLLVASGNQLILMGEDGSDQHTFLTTAGLAFWLRWSPDGKYLRFTLRNPEMQTSELWEVSADGSNPHPLLPGWSQPSSECCGSWTPDGDYFVFQSSHSGHSEIWMRREKPWYQTDSEPRQITNGPLEFQAPSTTPGGDRVYFIGATPQYELLRAMAGSAPPRVKDESTVRGPAFTSLDQNLSTAALAQYSHDGRWVAWLNAADNSLWRSRVDGSERIELTNPPLRIFMMRWSPDDRRLALMAEEPGKPWKIYLIDAEGGKLTPILNEDRNQADPAWTPDGRSIIFGSPPNRMGNDQPKAIFLLNLLTHRIAEIPGSPGLFSPRLSSDGRYMVAMPLDQHALLLFDRSTERWTTLTTHAVGDPTWSHNGRFVYFQDFVEKGKPIYKIAVPDGKPELVASIDDLRPVAATDYRLIGLAPGDLPLVQASTPVVNLYEVNLNEN
jgi:Tol biopolymer transport system component/DNA-binding winged helix-turn-helix (wHTH) protein